jgi:hypothetical protein
MNLYIVQLWISWIYLNLLAEFAWIQMRLLNCTSILNCLSCSEFIPSIRIYKNNYQYYLYVAHPGTVQAVYFGNRAAAALKLGQPKIAAMDGCGSNAISIVFICFGMAAGDRDPPAAQRSDKHCRQPFRVSFSMFPPAAQRGN